MLTVEEVLRVVAPPRIRRVTHLMDASAHLMFAQGVHSRLWRRAHARRDQPLLDDLQALHSALCLARAALQEETRARARYG